MKIYSKFIYLLLVVVSLSGCDDFLKTSPSNSATEDLLLNNTDGANVLLNGIYRHLNSSVAFDMSGISSLQYYLSSSGTDIAVGFSGMGFYQYYAYQPTRGESTHASSKNYWSYFYKAISNSNILLYVVPLMEGTEGNKNKILGQAYAIRAWSYFYLVRMYQQTYSIAKELPGIPLYLERLTPASKQKDRATVEDVYNQIISDLTEAEKLLSNFKREDITYINQDVVRGFLAEVYLTMEDWNNAALYAYKAREKYPLMTTEEFRSGFSKENKEWMWGFHQTAENNTKNENMFSLWGSNGHRESINAYVVKEVGIDDNFIALFDKQDARNQFKPGKYGDLNTSEKFRDEAPNHLGDLINMRAAEMLLIQAEAEVRRGNTSTALSLLNELQSARNVAVITQTSDATELLDYILLERRKELFSEGFDLFDIMRLQKSLVREGDSHDQEFTIPARSYRFLFMIPGTEMDLGGISVQNPKDEVYQL